MYKHVDACLDGDTPWDSLSLAERERLAALEATIEEAVTSLKARPAPDLALRVMKSLPQPTPARAVREKFSGAWQQMLAWLWLPHPVTMHFRAAYAFALLLAALMLQVPTFPWAPPGWALGAHGEPAAAAPVFVQFRIEVSEASQVALVGSFSGWQPRYELHETAPGIWSVLVLLEPGVHDYAFVVDGEQWIADPYAPRVTDSFSGTNNRLFLPSHANKL